MSRNGKELKEAKTFNNYKRKGMQRQATETFIKGKREHLLYKNRKKRTSQTVCHVKDWNSLSSLIYSFFIFLSQFLLWDFYVKKDIKPLDGKLIVWPKSSFCIHSWELLIHSKKVNSRVPWPNHWCGTIGRKNCNSWENKGIY